jgi:hypothetical protein
VINGKEKSAVTVARQRTRWYAAAYRQRQNRRIIVNVALSASPIRATLGQIKKRNSLAMPIKPGERWATRLRGIPLEDIAIKFGAHQ